MTYLPNDKQIDAHCAEEQLLGYGGAMGGGKTRWLCEMAKQLSIQFPGNFGLLARQSGMVLRMSTAEVFFSETLPIGSPEWKALGAKYNATEGILQFRHLDPASIIWFSGLDKDNLERIKSLNLGFFGIDEATEVAEATFLMLVTRLRRKSVPKIFRKGMVTANPEAGWVKRRFVDQKLSNHKFIFANYADNPHLPEDYPELFKTMPIRWQQKYLQGSWDAASGLIYKEFRLDKHIVPFTDKLPPEWRYMRGFDHGSQNPTACLGVSFGAPDDPYLREILGDKMDFVELEKFKHYPVLLLHKMYYGTGLVRDHRKKIHETWGSDKSIVTYADPSIWIKQGVEKMTSDGKPKNWCLADEYLEKPYPVRGLVKGNNQVLVGIDRISSLLRIGHLFFMDHSSNEPLVGDSGEMLSYAWKEPRVDGEDWPEEPIKQNDHACDALRYACMSLPPISQMEKKIIPYNSFVAARQRAIDFKKGRLKRNAKGWLVDRRGRLRGV